MKSIWKLQARLVSVIISFVWAIFIIAIDSRVNRVHNEEQNNLLLKIGTVIINHSHNNIKSLPLSIDILSESYRAAVSNKNLISTTSFELYDEKGNAIYSSANKYVNNPRLKCDPYHATVDRMYYRNEWYHVIKIPSSTGWCMRILERESERKQMLSSPLGLFSILLIILPMVILSIRFGLKRSLRPLTELGDFLQKKNKNDLSKITYGLNYKELNPVINAINEFIELNLERLRKESDFLTDMAHELRTPISAAVVSLHNIKLSMKWLPNLAYEMEILNASLERAVLLSKRVIELSRIGKQGNYDDSSIIHISKLIAYHITENYKEIKKRNLSVSFRGDEDISFKFSREILDCIIGNIISNACRYNKNNGAIDISSRLIYGGIYLSVSDSGCGIPKDQRELIFQRFHRVKNNNEIGSGLGLSIVKETLSLVGGRICVTDNIYHGSTFHVWIPMRQK